MDSHVNISIDSDVVKKAKEALINISALTEQAIKNKLNYKEIQVFDKCQFCDNEEPKAYVDPFTNKFHNGLTWLCPDEKWICTKCIRLKESHYDSRSYTEGVIGDDQTTKGLS